MFTKAAVDPYSSGGARPAPLSLPFYHPTRVAFIDDEPGYLAELVPALALDRPVSLYDSPWKLLADLDSGKLPTRIDLDCWSSWSGCLTDAGHDHVLALDKTMVVMRLFSRARFSPLSVAVVDYAMPEMNGLELCRRLRASPCKLVLLTGQTGQETAVDAFNTGVIDYFIPKGAPDALQRLRDQILRFQREYIADASQLIRHALRTHDAPTWDDPGLAAVLDRICSTYGIVEYYAVSDPAEGFLLVDRQGRGRLLLAFSAEALEAQLAAARLSKAPREVLVLLAKKGAGIYFADEDPNRILDGEEWLSSCVPVTPLPGRSDRWYSLLDHCRPFQVAPNRIFALDAFLEADR